MARPAPSEPDEDVVHVPASVRFPVELTPPPGFDPDRLETWPRVEGRLEWVGGRLLYMPPCGRRQATTVADAVTTLVLWAREHPGYDVGTNEAGMRLGDDTRAADVAVWRSDRDSAGPGLAHVAPVLAVEVAGRDEGAAELREKARWYLGIGVPVVWLLLPGERAVLLVTRRGERVYHLGDRLPAQPELPGLAPLVDELFLQVSATGSPG